MKFVYEYRTPDNGKHSGQIRASDRDAAFAALRRQGIRASRMTPAPGLFNRLLGCGKRWMVIVVLGILVVISAFVIRSNRQTIRQVRLTFDSTTRRQVIGDAAVIEKGVATGWADVFALEGDRFLASFAIPGVPAAVLSVTEEELRTALASGAKSPAPEDIEARQIAAIVSGLKEEARRFLAAGGSVSAYARRLVRRQTEEIGYYNRARQEIEKAQSAKMPQEQLLQLWESRNESLRKMGIRLVPMPDGT